MDWEQTALGQKDLDTVDADTTDADRFDLEAVAEMRRKAAL